MFGFNNHPIVLLVVDRCVVGNCRFLFAGFIVPRPRIKGWWYVTEPAPALQLDILDELRVQLVLSVVAAVF